MIAFRNKTLTTLLASLLGTFGLHRFYLQGARSWRPWLYPLFSWTLIPTVAGWIEALSFALTPDEKWDARWNAGSDRKSQSGWAVIIIAGLTLAAGAGLLMALIAFASGAYFGAGEGFG